MYGKFNIDTRDHSGYGLSQWKMTLHCNIIFHWLNPWPEWFLDTLHCSTDTTFLLTRPTKFHSFETDYIEFWWQFYQNQLGVYRADSRLVSSQWETSLQSSAISHWLGTNLESALYIYRALHRATASPDQYMINSSIWIFVLSVLSCIWCHFIQRSHRGKQRNHCVFRFIVKGCKQIWQWPNMHIRQCEALWHNQFL